MEQVMTANSIAYSVVKLFGHGKGRYSYLVWHMSRQSRQTCLNIDNFPTNFVVYEDILYYVDYECSHYDHGRNFENWGNDYWWKSPAFQIM